MPTLTAPEVCITLCSHPNVEALRELHAVFRDGYTPECVDRIMMRVREATGLEVGVIWDLYDSDGFGGNSEFCVILDGNPYAWDEGLESLSAHLFGGTDSIERPLRVILGRRLMVAHEHDFNFALTEVR